MICTANLLSSDPDYTWSENPRIRTINLYKRVSWNLDHYDLK